MAFDTNMNPVGSGVATRTGTTVEWGGEEYMRMMRRATAGSLRKIVNAVKAEAKRLAPLGDPHRVARRYQKGGKVYQDAKPIRLSLTGSVRSIRDTNSFSAAVRATVGYSIFVNFGRTTQTGRRIEGAQFLRKARARVAPRALSYLKGEMTEKDFVRRPRNT